MKLWLIVYEQLDGEPDWTLVAKESVTQNEAEMLALKHYNEQFDSDETRLDNIIGSVWCNEVYEVDGYDVKLSKKMTVHEKRVAKEHDRANNSISY